MNLSAGVNVYLHSVVIYQGIPFLLTLYKTIISRSYDVEFESASKGYIAKEIADAKANGHPIALFDNELKRAYLEYPDGHKDYEFVK